MIYLFIRKSPSKNDISKITKLWAFPLLVLGVLLPFVFIVTLFAILLYFIGRHHHLLIFDNITSLWTTALYIVIASLIYSLVIEKLIVQIYSFFLKEKMNFFIKVIIEIISLSLIFYFMGSFIPGAHIQNIYAAVTLSVIFVFIGGVIEGIHHLIKKNHNQSNE